MEKLARNEEGETFSQFGGAWVLGGPLLKCWCATWPFANLTVKRDVITLQILWNRYVFHQSSVARINLAKGCLSSGIQISHKIAAYPRRIVFWSLSIKVLLESLEKKGFQVGRS